VVLLFQVLTDLFFEVHSHDLLLVKAA